MPKEATKPKVSFQFLLACDGVDGEAVLYAFWVAGMRCDKGVRRRWGIVGGYVDMQ